MYLYIIKITNKIKNNKMENVSLQEFRELAYRAYYAISFSPDKRRDTTLKEHEEELNADLGNIPECERERYVSNYKKYFSSWLNAMSNCMSSMITGPSGFNVRRAEKANIIEHNRYKEFIDWREKALKAIAKRVEQSKPEEQKSSEDWLRLKRSILSSARTIREINDGENRYSNKALFVSSIYNKVETFAKKGNIEIVQKSVDLIQELNKESSIITERHRFFNLPEVAKAISEKIIAKNEKESDEKHFIGGRVIHNFEEDRLQLIFDEKPLPDIIHQLKKNGFRWSPRFMAWQRQLTNNAIYATNCLLKSNNLICQ